MPELLVVSLPSPDASGDPGSSFEIESLIRNQGESADTALIEIEFPEPSWILLPVPAVAVEAGQSRAVRFTCRIPAEASAGSYPMLVRVRSLETGAVSTAQGSVRIQPIHSAALTVAPARGHSTPAAPRARFLVRVRNTGNAPARFDLSAADPENACVFQMPGERVEVAPGEAVELALQVEPRRKALIAPPLAYGFAVHATPVDSGGPPQTAHGIVEFRALMTPLAAWVCLAVLAYGGFLGWQRLHGPIINQFEARPDSIVAGQPVTLIWDVQRTAHLTLQDDDVNQRFNLDPNLNHRVVSPNRTVNYTLIAEDNNDHSVRKHLQVTVEEAAPLPPPKILLFQAQPKSINFGASILLTWRVSGAKQLFLEPFARTLDPAITSFQDTPRQTTTYALVAKNQDGVSVRKELRVVVTPPPNPEAPKIAFFSATPSQARAGEPITLSWNITGAVSAVIPGIGQVDSQGSRTFEPERSSRFTLIATGPSGIQAQTSASVQVIQPPKILMFTARPATIPAGGTAQLIWSVHNAESVSIDGIGNVHRESSQDVKPDKTTTYTLHALDSTGHDTTSSTVVTVTGAEADGAPGAPPG